MTRRVIWSRAAAADFDGVIDYLNQKNPAAARRVAAQLFAATRALGAFPTGRPGRVSGTYEKVLRGLPYIVAYSIDHGTTPAEIIILRIIHGARHWPEDDWPA